MPALFPAAAASIVAGRRSSAPAEESAADARTAPTARAVVAGTQRRRLPGRGAMRTSSLLRLVIGSPPGPADAETVAVQGGGGTVEVVGVLEHRGEGHVAGVAVGERRPGLQAVPAVLRLGGVDLVGLEVDVPPAHGQGV